jgi:hypothetical protein
MSVLVDGQQHGAHRSTWQEPGEDTATSREPAGGLVMNVSLREHQLLLRLRMLESGTFVVKVQKKQRGMNGLDAFKVE